MKTSRFILGWLTGAVLIAGASFARQVEARSGPASTHPAERSPAHSHETEPLPLEVGKPPVKAEGIGEEVASRRSATVVKPRHGGQSHGDPIPIHAAPRVGTAKPSYLRSNRTQISNRSPGAPQVGTQGRLPAPATSARFRLNGNQFLNPHNPRPRLSSLGGPLNAGYGTASINGSNLRPKP